MSNFGEHLRDARKRARLTQQALADKGGVDDSYISKMEKEVDGSPSREVVLKLTAALGIREKTRRWLDFLLAAGVASAEDMEGFALVKIDDETEEEEDKDAGGGKRLNQNVVGHDRALKSGTQVKPTRMPSITNPAMAIPWKAIPNAKLDITEEKSDEIGGLIAAAGLSEEEEGRVTATLFEIAKQLLSLIATQRKTRKED